MSEPQATTTHSQDQHSELFASLVMQQANMAMMLLGKIAHPESGQSLKDLDGARLFIDHLEMIEAKTKGNLTKEEAAFLKQTLMSLRLGFVEAVDSGAGTQKSAEPAPQTPPAEGAKPGPEETAEDEEHRKKFTKKY
jgi:Domain of unknown function (DUF1844)